MFRYHYVHADGRYSNSKFSKIKPTEIPEPGGNWVLGYPNPALVRWEVETAIDYATVQLKSLPVESRTKYGNTMTQAILFLQHDDQEAFKAVINEAPADTPAEQTVKANIKTRFGV